MLLGPSLTLQVHRHEVRSAGHQEPDHLAAAARVAHEGRERGEHALGNTGVRSARFARAERRVGFVHHHGDRADRVEQRQDAL